MTNRSPVRLLWALACSTLLALVAMGPGTGHLMAQQQGCFRISNLSWKCESIPGSNNKRVNFTGTLSNISGRPARYLTLTVNSPSGIGVSPANQNINIASNGNGTINFSLASNTSSPMPVGASVLLTARICDSLQRCCTDTFRVTIPSCENTTPPKRCFELAEQEIACRRTDSGYMFTWCYNIRNLASNTVTSGSIRNVQNGAQGMDFQFANGIAPGGLSSRICMGVFGQPGQTIKWRLTLCRDTTLRVQRDSISPRGDTIRYWTTVKERICCDDTVSIRLPQCGDSIPPKGCFQLGNQRVECIRDSNSGAFGNAALFCYTLKNTSNFKARFVSIYSNNPSIQVQPSSNGFNPPLAPGATSSTQCVTIRGGQPGQTVTLIMMMCDSTQRNCCLDSVRVTIPHCNEPQEGCCTNFRKEFIRLTNSTSTNGTTSLAGFLTAGPALIKQVSATIVDSRINGQPVYGHFLNGFIRTSFGTIPYMHEFIWNSSPAANLSAPTLFNLRMRFPGIAPNSRADTLTYCIRFRYTDERCVTCDTVICFRRVRVRFIDNSDFPTGVATGKSSGDLLSNGEVVSGSLLPADKGQIDVRFPSAPAELGTVSYVGLRVMTPEVPITSATTADAGYSFGATMGMAEGTFNVKPGATLSLDLGYSGLGNRPTLEHMVTFRYVSSAMPGDTLEEEVMAVLRRSDLNGGDKVRPEAIKSIRVQTFALHLDNANPGMETIHRLVLESTGEAKILAVGPTSDPKRAIVQFGEVDGGNSFVGEVVGGGKVTIAPGTTHGPIYVTLDGTDLEETGAVVHFTTLNEYGQVISEGDVTLSNTLSVRQPEGSSGELLLSQSYPNPAGASTTIEFSIARPQSGVTVTVTDATGRVVATLMEGASLEAGPHAIYFDTKELPSGTYYYTVRAGGKTETRSMTILR